MQLLSATFDEVQAWIAANKLLLNLSMTEFQLLGTPQQLINLISLINKSLKWGDSIAEVAETTDHLGIVFNFATSLWLYKQ